MEIKWNGEFAYEVTGDGVKILRCFSFGEYAGIPGEIEGKPVAELASYAFSEHMDGTIKEKIDAARSADRLSPPQALCGVRLKEISLPETLERIGRYTFYNCSSLESIRFYSRTRDIGAGAFTGCHRVRTLDFTVCGQDAAGLKELLTELTEVLCVCYHGEEDACLWFPEYYEEGVENTPARILETHVHGTGLHYRNCFLEKEFQFEEYDSLFYLAKAQENIQLAARIALGRLLYPLRLTKEAEERYIEYLRENAGSVGCSLIENKELNQLEFLVKNCLPGGQKGRETLHTLTEKAGADGYAQAGSFLLDFSHTMYPSVRWRFVL